MNRKTHPMVFINSRCDNARKGAMGEERAVAYLVAMGYQILETNWRFGHKEIDIIAKSANVLVFVEVKYRKKESLSSPEESITPQKMKALTEAADAYIQSSPLNLDARFDVITFSGENELMHYEAAFYPEF